MDGMDYDIMLAANGTITLGYISGDEDAEEEGVTNEIIMGTPLQLAGDQAVVEFGVDNSSEDELCEEESGPGESDSEKIDAGMSDASDSDAMEEDDNAATSLHTIVQDGEAALAGPAFYIPGQDVPSLPQPTSFTLASKHNPINLASEDDKMSTQEAQAVFDKVDEVQMKLDEASDILEELKGDGNTLFLKRKYPQMKLMETISAVQAKLTALTNEEMEFMANVLQNLGAKFILDDAPAVAVTTAATTNKRPATVPTSPAPGNAAKANKRPAIAAGPSSPAINSSRVPRAPPAYIPPPPGHVVANTGTFRGHPAQLPMFKEDLRAEDKLLIQMKTGKKHSWNQITDAYVAMIGKEINQSTLTSRWRKIKKSYGEDALIAWGEELREEEYMRQALQLIATRGSTRVISGSREKVDGLS